MPSDNDDSSHRIPEDIEGRTNHKKTIPWWGCRWERWDLAGHVDDCSMMIIRNMQVPCQTNWSIGFIVVPTALTLESLFELSYRILKLFTWICNWIESIRFFYDFQYVGRWRKIIWDTDPSLTLDRLHNSMPTWMAKSLVQPEHLTDLVSSDAQTAREW